MTMTPEFKGRPFEGEVILWPFAGTVTVAAIDRLVHHATILEMNIYSYRRRAAIDRSVAMADGPATTTTDKLGGDNQVVADSREESGRGGSGAAPVCAAAGASTRLVSG